MDFTLLSMTRTARENLRHASTFAPLFASFIACRATRTTMEPAPGAAPAVRSAGASAPSNPGPGRPLASAASAEKARPLRPQSGSTVASGRVSFRWSAMEAHAELSRSRDFERTERVVSGPGTGVAWPDLEEGVWFWRVVGAGGRLSPTWSLRVLHHTVGPVLQGIVDDDDFNGDGRNDVVIPYGVLLGQKLRGARDMPSTLLAAGGLAVGELSRLSGELPLQWGDSEGLGDVDGDGFDDAAAMVERRAIAVEGRVPVRVWLRGARVLGPEWNAAGRVAYGMSRVGDVDGDGYADTASCGFRDDPCRIFAGSSTGPSERVIVTLPHYATLLGGADFDGDGGVDLVGVTSTGTLALYSSKIAPPSQTPAASVAIGGLESEVFVMDLDRDGIADVVGCRKEATRSPLWAVLGKTAFRSGITLEITLPAALNDRPPDAYVPEAGPNRLGALIFVDARGGAFDQLTGVATPRPVLSRGQRADGISRDLFPEEGPITLTTNVGDFDGDGFDDLLVARTADDVGRKFFYLYAGSSAPFRPERWQGEFIANDGGFAAAGVPGSPR